MNKTIHTESYRQLLGWLRSCRKTKKMSMRDLASRLKVPHTWIGKIEQAERRMDLVEYVRICTALDVDPRWGLDILQGAKTKSFGYGAGKLDAVAEKKGNYPER